MRVTAARSVSRVRKLCSGDPSAVWRVASLCRALAEGSAGATGLPVFPNWCGGSVSHESVETTYVYLHAELELKEEALAKTTPMQVASARFRPDDEILAFLNSLWLFRGRRTGTHEHRQVPLSTGNNPELGIMTQRMGRDVLGNAAATDGGLACVVDCAVGDMTARNLSRKQPLTCGPGVPAVVTEGFQQMGREHDTAVLGALALLDPEDHARAVDVARA